MCFSFWIHQIIAVLASNWVQIEILPMATEPKAATEDVKIDLFEDDDEFEEFEINEG